MTKSSSPHPHRNLTHKVGVSKPEQTKSQTVDLGSLISSLLCPIPQDGVVRFALFTALFMSVAFLRLCIAGLWHAAFPFWELGCGVKHQNDVVVGRFQQSTRETLWPTYQPPAFQSPATLPLSNLHNTIHSCRKRFSALSTSSSSFSSNTFLRPQQFLYY